MKSRGFTIVELIITVAIMGILLTLAVVNISSTQVNARDAERMNDIGSITDYLEIFYKNDATNVNSSGRYPSTALLASGETSLKTFLPGIDPTSAIAPGASDVSSSFKIADNNVSTTAGVLPQPAKNQYVYQPLQSDGTLCTSEAQECRKYAIFYRTEGKNIVEKIVSKNQ